MDTLTPQERAFLSKYRDKPTLLYLLNDHWFQEFGMKPMPQRVRDVAKHIEAEGDKRAQRHIIDPTASGRRMSFIKQITLRGD